MFFRLLLLSSIFLHSKLFKLIILIFFLILYYKQILGKHVNEFITLNEENSNNKVFIMILITTPFDTEENSHRYIDELF